VTRCALFAALATLLACEDTGARTRVATQSTPVDAAMPGPMRRRGEQAVALNATCERCHADVAREWRASLHQRANVEPAYQRAFAIEPMPFCRSCHAPEAEPHELPSEAVSELGVGCVTCHVTGDAVLAAPREGGRDAPHAVLRVPAFGSPDACASCHQFRFPGRTGSSPVDFMQTTLFEHQASAARDRSCAECHMPSDATGRRSHLFTSSRDPARMRAAVRVLATRTTASTVSVRLDTNEVGHAFPTGDLFRRVEVVAEAFADDHAVVATARRYLTRHFEHTSRGRVLRADDRLTDEGRVLTLELGEAARDLPIAYRVSYQRVAHPEGALDEAAELEDEIVLAEGELPPP
jgi:hypothetical protein